MTTALYGLIGIIGVKIWLDNKVDFSKSVHQFTAATALIIGIADFTLNAGSVTFNGIALGTVAAIVIYDAMTAVARLRGTDAARATRDHPKAGHDQGKVTCPVRLRPRRPHSSRPAHRMRRPGLGASPTR